MNKQERLTLNALSKQVFGASSTWNDIVNKGKVIPKLGANGKPIAREFVHQRMSVEQVTDFMQMALKLGESHGKKDRITFLSEEEAAALEAEHKHFQEQSEESSYSEQVATGLGKLP